MKIRKRGPHLPHIDIIFGQDHPKILLTGPTKKKWRSDREANRGKSRQIAANRGKSRQNSANFVFKKMAITF